MPEFAQAPLVVIAAPNGARLNKRGHPAVPVTTAEIAAAAAELAECGVSVLHLHVRGDRGEHVLDAERYREAQAAIRDRVGDRLVVQVTTEAVGRYERGEQMALVRELRPDELEAVKANSARYVARAQTYLQELQANPDA